MILEKIKQFLSNSGITQAKLARETGINAGALSSYLNGSYAGDIANLEAKLSAYFELQQVKEANFVEAPDFIETKTAKDIFKTCDGARVGGDIATIYGASGVGKTQAVREYRKRNSNVWLVTASPSRSSLMEILFEIALELGIDSPKRNKAVLARMIRKRMDNRKGLLIIDEADHLPYEALEELRLMPEEVEGGVGLVLVGNDKVYTRMRGGINPQHEYARLWSRVANRTPIQKVKKQDVVDIAMAWGLTDNTDIMLVLHSIADTAGNLRSLTKTLKLAAMAAKGLKQPLTADLIKQARAELLGKGE